MTIKTKPAKIAIIGIVILSLFYLTISLIYKPIVSNDAVNGMLSLNNYLNGDQWNKTLSLSKDATHIYSSELTWWAPGQYELPYLFSKLLSIDLGSALALLIFASVVGGCFFYYKVFKLSLIEHKIVLAALVILLCQRFVNIYFIQYNSSDIFLFFLTPFYIYCYQRILNQHRGWLGLKLLILIAINIIGVFIKSSFILFELAVNIFLVVEYFVQRRIASEKNDPNESKISLLKTVLLIIPFALANVLNYWFFLRRGENPTLSPGLLLSLSNILKGVFVPVVQILFSSLSINSIYGNFYDKIILRDMACDLIMVAVLVFVGYIIYRYRTMIWDELKRNLFSRFTAVVAVMYVLFWFTFTIKQSYISNEDRLYLPVAILVLPYLLRFSLNSSRLIKYFYFTAIGISIIYGGYTFAYRIKKYAINGSVPSKSQKLNGFRVYSTNEKLEDLNKIADTISMKYPNDYILINDPDLAFKLNVPNKFIVATSSAPKRQVNSSKKANYLVLGSPGKNIIPPQSKLKKIYAVDEFVLYRSY